MTPSSTFPPTGSSLVETTLATAFASLAVLAVLRSDLHTVLVEQFHQMFWLITLPL